MAGRARAGQRWTKEEKAILVHLIRSGRSIEEAANQLQRSPGAARSRIAEKGLLATSDPDVRLEAGFHAAMLDVYTVAAKQKYHATRFLQMVRNRGGVEVARLLLAREEVTSGLRELQKLDLLQYSMEATVLQERFEPLFTEAERQKARRRLESLGFRPE
jgi:transposase-like protein